MDAKAIADKYISREGREPAPAKPLVAAWLEEKEIKWLRKAVMRSGYMPTQDRDGHEAPRLSEMRSLVARGVVQGIPWRISKRGREALAEHELQLSKAAPCPAKQKIDPIAPVIVPLAMVERKAITDALAACSNNKSRAARLLGISVRTIRNKLSSYRIGE